MFLLAFFFFWGGGVFTRRVFCGSFCCCSVPFFFVNEKIAETNFQKRSQASLPMELSSGSLQLSLDSAGGVLPHDLLGPPNGGEFSKGNGTPVKISLGNLDEIPGWLPNTWSEGVWTPKTYLKHQTSGGIWKTRDIMNHLARFFGLEKF